MAWQKEKHALWNGTEGKEKEKVKRQKKRVGLEKGQGGKKRGMAVYMDMYVSNSNINEKA